MSVLSNYFTGRYIERLDELLNDVQNEIATNKGEESFQEYLPKRMEQFRQTTQLHIKGLERQNVSTNNTDMKYMKFMDPSWIIIFLTGKAFTKEIEEA